MSDKQETIADIVAEMRGLVNPGETLGHTYELLSGLADRIEAAQKREIEALTAKLEEARHCWKVWSDRANELKNKCNEQYAKLKTVGNGAKMREALECVVEELENSRIHTNGRLHFCGMVRITHVREKAKYALAAPPRNCDRFNTLEDALAAWREVSPDESGPFDDWLFAEAKGDAKCPEAINR